MSDATPPRPPGLPAQAGTRTFLRVGGAVALVAGLAFTGVAGVDFFGGMNSFEGPTKFWMFFVGLPLLALGGGLLQAGFLGAGTRYAAGETAPVLKDTAHYLSDGAGVLGVGRSPATAPAGTTGPYCRHCGTRNDADARFCDACGSATG